MRCCRLAACGVLTGQGWSNGASPICPWCCGRAPLPARHLCAVLRTLSFRHGEAAPCCGAHPSKTCCASLPFFHVQGAPGVCGVGLLRPAVLAAPRHAIPACCSLAPRLGLAASSTGLGSGGRSIWMVITRGSGGQAAFPFPSSGLQPAYPQLTELATQQGNAAGRACRAPLGVGSHTALQPAARRRPRWCRCIPRVLEDRLALPHGCGRRERGVGGQHVCSHQG